MSAVIDQSNMKGAIESLGDQLESGYATAREQLAAYAERGLTIERPAAVVVCAMGGSAIGGDLIFAALPELPVPALVVRGYELPTWVDADTLVVAVSYSGGTEETLACVAKALQRGCRLCCVTSGGRLAQIADGRRLISVTIPGGQQPRASLGYLAAPLLALLEAAGLCGDHTAAIAETAALLRAGNESVPAAARALAEKAHGAQVAVYGCGRTAPVARRWKGQINENAKAPATFAELPEADHNEIMAWTSLPAVSATTLAVFLDDEQLDQRLRRRLELTAEIVRGHGVAVERLGAGGESALARLFSLIQVGDFFSYSLALLYEVDPTPVAAIEDFKRRLAAETDAE